ncbi:MAG: hypothetical protein WD250_06575 [Egibacteraceae bacterium]
MSTDVSECPARMAYDTLVAEPALSASGYRAVITALHPTWVEEVVCPIHIAVGHLRRAADAVASGRDRDARAGHAAARTYLYQALSAARLLTHEERLQELVVDTLLQDARPEEPVGSSSGRIVHGWEAWRRTDAP